MKKISKNVFWMGMVSFFTDISSEMIFPVLPMFLSGVLGASMSFIGLIEGIAESTASLLKVVSGWLSDKFRKRKIFVVFGYSLSALAKPFFAVAKSVWVVLGARFFDRVGKGLRTAPRDALIAASTEEGARGSAFGFHRMMDTLGAVLGTATAAFVVLKMVNTESAFRTVFWIAAVPGIFASLIAIFLVKERLQTSQAEKSREKIKWKDIPKQLKTYILITGFFELSAMSYAFLILRAKSVGISEGNVILIYLLFNVIYAATAYPFGKMSDRIGKRTGIIISYIVYAGLMFGFALANSSLVIILMFALYGIHKAILEPVARAYISELSQEQYRGTALGVYHTLAGTADLPANLIAGFLWDRVGTYAPFMFSGIVGILSAIALWITVSKN